MADVHFIVSSVAGVMLTACEKSVSPKQAKGARVGIYGQICKDCEAVVKAAWITIQ